MPVGRHFSNSTGQPGGTGLSQLASNRKPSHERWRWVGFGFESQKCRGPQRSVAIGFESQNRAMSVSEWSIVHRGFESQFTARAFQSSIRAGKRERPNMPVGRYFSNSTGQPGGTGLSQLASNRKPSHERWRWVGFGFESQKCRGPQRSVAIGFKSQNRAMSVSDWSIVHRGFESQFTARAFQSSIRAGKRERPNMPVGRHFSNSTGQPGGTGLSQLASNRKNAANPYRAPLPNRAANPQTEPGPLPAP